MSFPSAVPAVHAGYAKRRKPLLEAGIALFEMKRSNAAAPVTGVGVRGSSASSLHAKTFAVDRSRVFIGSFNFDPRSVRLNTELGFVIDSAVLAQAMAGVFATEVRSRAYRVVLSDAGALQWVDDAGGAGSVQQEEPGAGLWRRLAVRVLSLLPIEWLL